MTEKDELRYIDLCRAIQATFILGDNEVYSIFNLDIPLKKLIHPSYVETICRVINDKEGC